MPDVVLHLFFKNRAAVSSRCSLCRLSWDLRLVSSMNRFRISQCKAFLFKLRSWGGDDDTVEQIERGNDSVQHHWDIFQIQTCALVMCSKIPDQRGCEYYSWIHFLYKHFVPCKCHVPSHTILSHTIHRIHTHSHPHIICTFLQSSLWHEDRSNTGSTHA